MATYNAPEPKYSFWEWFNFFAIRIAFPPVLLWDLIKIVVNQLTGRLVGRKLVIPAVGKYADTEFNPSEYDVENLTFEKHEVITHDQASLDTFEIKHSSQENIDPQYQKYIINFVGNDTCYGHIFKDMIEDAHALKSNVIGFSYRGVGLSKLEPKSGDDLMVDGIAQVQRLLDNHVSPQTSF